MHEKKREKYIKANINKANNGKGKNKYKRYKKNWRSR